MQSPDEFIDITVALDADLPIWPGDPALQLDPVARIERGDGANVSRLCLSTHAGTHVDAPWHVLAGGARLDSLRLDDLIGDCFVCDLRHLDRHIEASDLAGAGIPEEMTRILLRTRNSDLWSRSEPAFYPDFIALAPDAARWIVRRGIRLVGIDHLSVEPFDGTGETHDVLLRAGVIPLETLDLRAVEPGRYRLICLPIKLAGADGAPCRAVLARSEVRPR